MKLLLFLSALSVNVFAQGIDNSISSSPIKKIIYPGQQSPEANARHQKKCKDLGGVDITNSTTSTVGADTKDAVVCSFPNELPAGQKAGIIPVK